MPKDRYIIIAKTSETDLQDEINKKLNVGYILAGGLSICFTNAGAYYYQAILLPDIKPEKKKKNAK